MNAKFLNVINVATALVSFIKIHIYSIVHYSFKYLVFKAL